MRTKMKLMAVIIAAVAIVFTACGPAYPEGQQKVTLITGGYGYETGDIVLLDSQRTPQPGDIVQYDWHLNKSDCLAMGPGKYLARIVAAPGDLFITTGNTICVNDYSIQADLERPAIFGTERFDSISNLNLSVPPGEFLADKWLGFECTGEVDAGGSSKAYSRYTVKQEAVTGVIIQKTGHDAEFAEKQKQFIYYVL